MKTELFSLKGRVIVITGAAGLLGRQHAEAVVTAGGTPVLLDLRQEPVDQLADVIRKTDGVDALGYAVDITQEHQVESNCKTVVERFGRIDALINNAANNPKVENNGEKNFSRLENFPMEAWQADLAVGLTGAFLCAKHYGTAISNNANGGVILNISSDLGVIAPDQRLYRQTGLRRSSSRLSQSPIPWSRPVWLASPATWLLTGQPRSAVTRFAPGELKPVSQQIFSRNCMPEFPWDAWHVSMNTKEQLCSS